MAATTLHRNAIFRSKVIKSIEKMKTVLTDPAYLQQVVAFECQMFENTRFLRSNSRLFLMHFCDGSETRIIHCKNVWLLMIWASARPIFNEILDKYECLSTSTNNDKTGVFWHAQFIVKTDWFDTAALEIVYILVKTDGWCMWASPLCSGIRVFV